MSSSESGAGCVSEVTLAISKTKASKAGSVRVASSPDSDASSSSNSYSEQNDDYSHDGSANGDSDISKMCLDGQLRIPIIGYEVMEERARFTVYKLRVEFKTGDCWFVFRRYTDFVRLFTQMRKQKAQISHLSLPRKKWLGDNFAPSFLENRIRGLQNFVNGLLSTPQLISLNCVRQFFCLDEPPALSDAIEESRAIFEALEDTIYHLRNQLKERDEALAAEYKLRKQLEAKVEQLSSEIKLSSSDKSP